MKKSNGRTQYILKRMQKTLLVTKYKLLLYYENNRFIKMKMTMLNYNTPKTNLAIPSLHLT